jgi:hypothetical protein
MTNSHSVVVWNRATALAKDLGFEISLGLGMFIISANPKKHKHYAKDDRVTTLATIEECIAFFQGWAVSQDYIKLTK